MSKRSIRGESSSTAHTRDATASKDDEGPLPSSSSSSSFLDQSSSSSIPKIPVDLIAGLILPFVADRATWNSVCCASKDLCLAGKKMMPPWPNKAFNVGLAASEVAFSPAGSQLAFGVNAGRCVIRVWDRWGEGTVLFGHTDCINCLEYSLDGEYLASGSQDGSIRIWHSGLFHDTSSKTFRERSTPTPHFADTILFSSLSDSVLTLSFSRTDSNVLASGCTAGVFRVWNVKEQACIHSFDTGHGCIRSLYFAGGADSSCIAVKNVGHSIPVIRFWRAEGTSDLASETIGDAAGRGRWDFAPRAVFSRCGSILVSCTGSSAGKSTNKSTLALYELETMTKTQTVCMPGFSAACLAVSPDSKQLVVGDTRGRIRLVQIDDFGIEKDLVPRAASSSTTVLSLAFDPTCRGVLALGCRDGLLDLLTL
jgi:WD40 repeat protein